MLRIIVKVESRKHRIVWGYVFKIGSQQKCFVFNSQLRRN